MAEQRELAEHEHHQRIIAQGADPELLSNPDTPGRAFSVYSGFSRATGGRVNSTGSKIFYGSEASTPTTLCPDGEADNYQDDVTEEDLSEYYTLESCQYNQGDTVLTAHDGSDDPVTCKYSFLNNHKKLNFQGIN